MAILTKITQGRGRQDISLSKTGAVLPASCSVCPSDTKMTWEIGKVLQVKTLSALRSVTRGQQKQSFASAFLSGDATLAQSHMHMWKICRQVRVLQWKRAKGKEGPSWL